MSESSLFEKVNDELYRAGIFGTVSLSELTICNTTFQPFRKIIFTRPDGTRFSTPICYSLEFVLDSSDEIAPILLEEIKDWISRVHSKLGLPSIVKAR